MAAAADHVADMHLGHLILGEIQHRIALRLQGGDHLVALIQAVIQPDAGEYMGLVGMGVTVVELGNRAVADGLAELTKTPRPLGDGDRQDRLAVLAQLGTLCHVRQA